MDYLNDDNLEELGLIKEINTLEIVKEAQKIKEKRNKKMLFILFAVMIVVAFIGQLLFTLLFGGIRYMRIGISIYIFISVVVALVLIDKGEKSLC